MHTKSEKLRDSNYTCIDTHTHTHTHTLAHTQTLTEDINISLNTTGPIPCTECSVDTTVFTVHMYHKEVDGNTHRSAQATVTVVSQLSTLVSGVYIIENSLIYPIRLHSNGGGGVAMVLFNRHCMNMYTHTHIIDNTCNLNVSH